ncbi:HAD-IIIA family hydrolase [bacterium]|nr:HAD-IIIA family hydrolase [bacterium]
MPTTSKYRAAVLIDRDGTINEEVDYLHDPAQLRLLPGAARAIRILDQENIAAIICTNQSGIARGYFTEERLQEINARLVEMLRAEGAEVEGIYYSTTLPESGDPMRKPNTGMFDKARKELGLDGIPIYSIGDRTLDVEFGINCGGKGIRVLTGHQLKEDLPYNQRSMYEARAKGLAFTMENLLEAVHFLLADLIRAECPDDVHMHKKFADLYTTARALEVERERENRIVLANGCFDLLHGGHISYLQSCREMGDCLVLAVNSSKSVSRLKGDKRPILPEVDRLQLLAALRCVDYLTIFHEDSADHVLEALRPNIHAKGTDYKSENVPERITSKRLGIETKIAGDPKENSSRDIIDVVVERAKAGML